MSQKWHLSDIGNVYPSCQWLTESLRGSLEEVSWILRLSRKIYMSCSMFKYQSIIFCRNGLKQLLFWLLLRLTLLLKVAICHPSSKKHQNGRDERVKTITSVGLYRIKMCHFIFDYIPCISSSIFILYAPMETGMNTLESHVIYLYFIAWWRHNCDTSQVKTL